MKLLLKSLGVWAFVIGSTGVASAAVIDGMVTSISGDVAASFQLLDADNFANAAGKLNNDTFVGKNDFNNPDLYAFNEVQNKVLQHDLIIDGGVLAAGTRVSSHYVFFDPRRYLSQQGWVSFSGDIIGLITTTSLLTASNSELGASGVTYRSPRLLGLEKSDSVIVNPVDARRILVDWKAGSPGDYVRVITGNVTPVPVPAGMPLLLLGIGGLGWVGRRKPTA